VTFERPISRREASRIETQLVRDGAPPLSVRDVLARSFGVVRQRWLSLALLTYGLGFAPRLVLRLTVSSSYHRGSHDVRAFAIYCAESLGVLLLLQLSRWAVTSVALASKGRGRLLAEACSVLGMLPTLLAVWLVSDYDVFWSFWFAWTNPLDGLIHARAFDENVLVLIVLLNSLIPLIISLLTVTTLGVLTPVILAERKPFASAVIRTWRLMRGSRGRILALYAVILGAEFVGGLPETVLVIAQRGNHGGNLLFVSWVEGAVGDAIEAFWAVILASAYLELRLLREGPPHEQLAQVFE